MFESEFLTSSAESKESYRQLISQAAELVCECFPSHAYSGANFSELTALISGDFLPEHGLSSDQIAATFRSVVSNSVAVSDAGAIAHLHCPPLLASLAAEVVISALNQSMDSFDQAPIGTILEQKLVRWLCTQSGLPASADGTFTAGGSQSNYMGLLLARDAFLKKQWNWPAQKQGLHPEAGRLRILCSEVAHFTVEKSAAQLGLGTDAVVRVACDDQFRMSLTALRQEIDRLQAQGLLPMAIVATAGNTDFGSIDPDRPYCGDCPPGGSLASRGRRLRWRSSVFPWPARQTGRDSKPPTPFPSTSTSCSGSPSHAAFFCWPTRSTST